MVELSEQERHLVELMKLTESGHYLSFGNVSFALNEMKLWLNTHIPLDIPSSTLEECEEAYILAKEIENLCKDLKLKVKLGMKGGKG